MICQYCGHKLTDGKCFNPACPGKLRRESMSELKCIYWKNATPDDFINARRGETWIQGVGEVDTFYAEDLVHNFGKAWKEKLTLALVEVERLVDDLLSVSKQLGQSEARGLYDHIEPAEVAINDLKSRLLATLTNATPYLSQDVIVPVEKLKAGRYRMMIPVEISTTGGLLLDRRDGIHGYSLEDYPNARFFKGW